MQQHCLINGDADNYVDDDNHNLIIILPDYNKMSGDNYDNEAMKTEINANNKGKEYYQ